MSDPVCVSTDLRLPLVSCQPERGGRGSIIPGRIMHPLSSTYPLISLGAIRAPPTMNTRLKGHSGVTVVLKEILVIVLSMVLYL